MGNYYSVSAHDRWVITHFAKAVSRRIQNGNHSTDERRTLLRLLFGLQRFPQVTTGLSVQISWTPQALNGQGLEAYEIARCISVSSEALSINIGYTRLQYFQGSHQLFDFHELLEGQKRQEFLAEWVGEFDDLACLDQSVSVEDYSEGDEVDMPPVSDDWYAIEEGAIHGAGNTDSA